MVRPEVLIVGAGPVGLTLALALHNAGVAANTILVADMRPSRIPTVLNKALSMSASSLEVFRTLGIVERFLAAGLPIHKAHFGSGPRLLDLSYEVLGTKYPYNYSIPQSRTESILLARCEEVGLRIQWGRKFVGLKQGDDAVFSTFENVDGTGGEMETITSSWLVGCDGTRSAVRQATDISWTGTRTTRYCWAVDCAVDPDGPGLLTGSDEGGKALMYSLGPGKARLGGNFPPNETVTGQRPLAPDEAYVREWARRHFGRDFGVRDVEWSTVLGNNMSIAGTLRTGRVFIAGDAAHQIFPAGGQGMNTGLLDVANLAWKLALVITGKLASPDKVDGVLDTYTRERKPAIEAVIKNVRVQMSSMFATGDNEHAVADFVAETLDQPALNRLWAKRVTGFGDPIEPYRYGSEAQDDLIGTRLTHIADAHLDDVLQAASKNNFVLAAVRADSDEPANLDWKDVFTKHKSRLIALDRPLETTSEKWAGVKAVLLRPDLRIAWILRTGSDLNTSLELLSSILSWWFGE